MVSRPARNWVRAHAPRRAVPDPHASRAQPGTRAASCLPLASSTAGRRAHGAAAVLALDHSTLGLAAAVARAVVVPPGHPLSLLLSSASRAAIEHVSTSHLCVASARACVRNGGRGVWRAPQKRPRPLLPPPRQPPTCCLAKNRLTCPCQAQNAKNRRRKAARARRAAPTVARPYRHLSSS